MLSSKKVRIRIISFVLSLLLLVCPHVIIHADALTSGEASAGDTAPSTEAESTAYGESSDAIGETVQGNISGVSLDQSATATATSTGSYALPDGIYAFKNLGNANRWMDIQQNLTTPGYHVQQFAFGTSPAESYSASGLYKVTRVGNTDRFIIRLMLNMY